MKNSSFRDNSGYMFKFNGEVYRQINKVYQSNYETLMDNGLYEALDGLLIRHQEVELDRNIEPNCFKIIKPEQIRYITYPYEWTFSQLKDAALLTLRIQKIAMKYGMSLKDSSAYNIQFVDGKPVFIDTLSFEKYDETKPWIAYAQFCRHFLAPLALMSMVDINLNKLLITYIDGVPLDLCKKLLPFNARLNVGLLFHIIMHQVHSKKHEADVKLEEVKGGFSRMALEGILDSLKSTIQGLKFPYPETEWGDYYNNTNYSDVAEKEKQKLVKEFLERVSPKTVCDLGANRGDYSRIASDMGAETLAFDIDMVAVEKNYVKSKKESEKNLLPLVCDLTNPAPAIGFANLERDNFSSRFKCDVVMALALIHHISISNNVPFDNSARFFASLGEYLVIEFVPKSDSKVQILLGTREDIFDDYTPDGFEKAYSEYYDIVDKQVIESSERILYLMRRK